MGELFGVLPLQGEVVGDGEDLLPERVHQLPPGLVLALPMAAGVVVFARNTKAARRLAEQFHERRVTKVYWAAVEGEVQPAEGTWDDWLRKLPETARSMGVDVQ